MISSERLFDLSKRLGLKHPSLDPNIVEDELGHAAHILVPRLVWFAELDYEISVEDEDVFTRQVFLAGARCLELTAHAGQPTISLDAPDSSFTVVHSCVISVPPHTRVDVADEFPFEQPLPSLIIPEAEDKVFAALKHLDFTEFEEEWRTRQFDGSFIDFSLTLFTGVSYVELIVDTSEFDKHPTLEALWRALLDTVDQLNEIYNHPVLRRYLS